MDTSSTERVAKDESNRVSDDEIVSKVLTKNVKDSTTDLLDELAMNMVRDKLQSYKSNILSDFKKKIDCMVEDVLQEMKRYNIRSHELKQLLREQSSKVMNNTKGPPTADKKRRQLPEKEFVARNSLLIDLFEVKHINSIYNIFTVMLILLFLNTFIHDFVAHGRVNIGLTTIAKGFSSFHMTLFFCATMHIPVLTLYYMLKLWAHFRRQSKGSVKRILDITCLISFIMYQCGFLIVYSVAARKYNMGVASRVTVLMEMTRLIMKQHAFVRHNVPRQLEGKLKSESSEPARVPSLQQYVYYLFAPTLVYRDSYPRTSHIRWGFVVKRFLEVLGTIFLISYLHERLMHPNVLHFGRAEIEPGKVVLLMFSSIFPGILLFLSGFFCLLHAWLNATSEMLRFADRQFYTDWWNSCTFDDYYRRWNVVVHDWLYQYIYKDVYHHILKGNKTAAALIVFVASAVVHEHILSLAFGFFYPVMFVNFMGIGVFLFFVTKRVNKSAGNLFLWFSLPVGNGLMIALYYMEHYARLNCPLTNHWTEFFIPISWSCNGIVTNPNWKVQVPWE